jgi:hypothetical protein
VINSANDSLPIVANLSDVVIQRLEHTIPLQQQIVSVEDRITLEEMQTSLTSVLLVSLKEEYSYPKKNPILTLPGYRSTPRGRNKASNGQDYDSPFTGSILTSAEIQCS